MYFSGFAIPPEDGLQAAAAGGLRAAPPEVLNASSYDKKANSTSRKRRNITKKILKGYISIEQPLMYFTVNAGLAFIKYSECARPLAPAPG
jgi:hypothetical protein